MISCDTEMRSYEFGQLSTRNCFLHAQLFHQGLPLRWMSLLHVHTRAPAETNKDHEIIFLERALSKNMIFRHILASFESYVRDASTLAQAMMNQECVQPGWGWPVDLLHASAHIKPAKVTFGKCTIHKYEFPSSLLRMILSPQLQFRPGRTFEMSGFWSGFSRGKNPLD